jgi:hypothetical protein
MRFGTRASVGIPVAETTKRGFRDSWRTASGDYGELGA